MIEMVLAAHAAQIKSCGHLSSFAQGDFWHDSTATITVQQKPPKVSRHAKHAPNMSRAVFLNQVRSQLCVRCRTVDHSWSSEFTVVAVPAVHRHIVAASCLDFDVSHFAHGKYLEWVCLIVSSESDISTTTSVSSSTVFSNSK
jgi:hypothetical protein